MIRVINKIRALMADAPRFTNADRRHWYIVDRIAALEKRVEALEEANRSSKR
ncbi:hypothetical protein [Desulfovibrio sp. 1214_IL3152]|uniref:hypothetical protein n=1 Tax=Desulfovibrio sp. 1214_IL3152 TaxID=3084056 RepID=UPI002FD9D3D6